MSSPYKVQFQHIAEKQLDRLDKPIRARVLHAVAKLADDPRRAGAIRLSGVDDVWRIRAGDYRILYTIRDMELIVEVVRLAHRSKVYRDLS